MVTAKDVLRELNEILNSVSIENHPEWAEIIKEIITDAKEKVEFVFDSVDIEEENDDNYGIFITIKASLSQLESMSDKFPLEIEKKIEKLYRETEEDAIQNFYSKFRDDINFNITDEEISFSDLTDLLLKNSRYDLANKLDEIHLEIIDYKNEVITLFIKFNSENSVSVGYNFECFFNKIASKEITIEFKDAKELKNKAEKVMKEYLDFIGVK